MIIIINIRFESEIVMIFLWVLKNNREYYDYDFIYRLKIVNYILYIIIMI